MAMPQPAPDRAPLQARPGRPVLVAGDLADLRGPVTGTVELPLWLFWSPDRTFDLDDPATLRWMYQTVLREAARPGTWPITWTVTRWRLCGRTCSCPGASGRRGRTGSQSCALPLPPLPLPLAAAAAAAAPAAAAAAAARRRPRRRGRCRRGRCPRRRRGRCPRRRRGRCPRRRRRLGPGRLDEQPHAGR